VRFGWSGPSQLRGLDATSVNQGGQSEGSMSMHSPSEKDQDDRLLLEFAYTMSGSCQMTSRSIQEMGRRNAYP